MSASIGLLGQFATFSSRANFSLYFRRNVTFLPEVSDVWRWKLFVYEFQSNYPARVKQLHVYNFGALIDLVMTVIKFCMPEKLQQRVR